MSKFKEKYPEASTSRTQRLAIWIICGAMAIGTVLVLFLPMIFANNPEADPNKIAEQRLYKEYMKQIEEENNQAEMENNYEVFGGYELKTFDGDGVNDLVVETIRDGDGDVVAETNTIKAYYTGWRPDGTIFDSTKSKDADNETRSFGLNEVIQGWTKGLAGKKVGGVYMLTIPSAMAYGEYGAGRMIPPNTPLRFIVEIIAIEK